MLWKVIIFESITGDVLNTSIESHIDIFLKEQFTQKGKVCNYVFALVQLLTQSFRMIPEGLYNRTKLYGFFLELDSHGHYELSLHRKHSLKILFFSIPQKNNSIHVWDDMGE